MVQVAIYLVYLSGSVLGAGISRLYFEGRKISIYDPFFKKGFLNGGIQIPFTMACEVLASFYCNAKKYDVEKKKKITVLVGISAFLASNAFSKENWKLKVLSHLGAIVGMVAVSCILGLFIKKEDKTPPG